jgi:multidrug efflux pump
MGQIAGANSVVFPPPPLPGTGHGLPVQFVIGTTDSFTRLDEVSQAFLEKAQASGLFMYVDADLKIDKPQSMLEVDRDKLAQMGLTMQDVGAAMASMLGGGYVNYFSMSGRSYKVIPQVKQSERLTADQLMNYQIKTASGESIAVSTFATIKTTVVPVSINHFQQLNSSTISGILMPGITLGQGLDQLKTIAGQVLPEGYSIDYGGESRQYMQESSALLVTFAFALQVVGKLHNQNAVLADQTDKRHQADLGIDIKTRSADAETDENQRSADGHGYADENNDRVAETFEQRGQGKKNDDQREGESDQQRAGLL